MRIVVKTDNVGPTTDTQFELRMATSGTALDFTVTKVSGPGDLVGDPVTHNTNNVSPTFDFTVAGTYELLITGTLRGIRFVNLGDKDKLLEIKEWGVFDPGSYGIQQFEGCSNLIVTATDLPTFVSNDILLRGIFRSCTSLTDVPGFGSWPTASIASLNDIFRLCASFDGALSNIGDWDVSSATRMDYIFFNVDTAFNEDISDWTPISCTNWAFFHEGAGRGWTPDVYNKILSKWSRLALQPNQSVPFGAASQYDISGDAEQSRFYLMTKVLSQACTFTADTITAETHGLVLDDVITFTTAGTLPTGLAVATRYWVVNPTADTFQISATKGGAAITFTADDTSTHTVEGGFNWSISDGGDTGDVQPAEGDVYIFTNSTPVLDGDNNPVQNAKVVLMRYDKLEALTAGAVNQADIVMGVALTDVSGNFSVNVTAFTNFDPLQNYIGICYKDGTPILTYVPVKITPVAEA